MDTSGGSGNLLADIVAAAITTGLTDYAPVAAQVHATASTALLFGDYHPRSGIDGMDRSVNLALKDAALTED